MALTGLQIYKLLPKTNCKECGFPTCLAFAMKLAAKQADLSQCPYVSEEAKQALAEASAPPIRLVTIGVGDKKVEVGNEIVLFRHEKTFYNPPGIFIKVKDTLPLDEAREFAQKVVSYSVERVGRVFSPDGLAIENASGEPEKFAACVEAVRSVVPEHPFVLISENPTAMKAALEKEGNRNPLIYAATPKNWQEMAQLAKEKGVPLAVRADGDLSALASLAEQIRETGVEDLFLDPGKEDPAGTLTVMTQIRRLALKHNFRPLGYPMITMPGRNVQSLEEEALLAAQHIAKYGGVIVLEHFDPAVLYPLFTLRLNIYTDPQKPIQVSPGVYEIGKPGPESPLLVTTNFSLTYFSVSGETAASGIPSWLLVCDTEGMSVLTAWAAGKFDAEKIAKSVKQYTVEEKIKHRKIIIPGHVAVISGELEDELPGWEVMVGPREAVDIPNFLKAFWSAN
ncbi:MAG: acetyl-CoA decarbonylase/synthase complex subunit gamma [Anaerolineae bacterium]|nr:acetyl-CoA decarbonylase/synthase complex subunit gamma [Anaerolineae bacterium]MDW8102408.1 acetyl-CoA decarbonylase/synthase complex subunit gamma [Anaerolineae bacterium]